MRTLSMTKEQFDAEGIRLDAEFESFAFDMIRSGKIGGKKRYFKNKDGEVYSRKTGIWARVQRRYDRKEKARTMPRLPQYADVEDTSRSATDKQLQIEHLQDRYHRCRDLHSGEYLTGEARKEWEKGRESRQFWIPEKKKSRVGGSNKTDTLKALTEVFGFVAKLDPAGIERFQELVSQYKDGDENNYPS